MKTISASLATLVVLGVLLAAADISHYFDLDHSEKQPAGGPAESETERHDEETTTFRVAAYDYIAAHLGLGMILSEIGRGMRDLTNFKRCWLIEARQEDMDVDVARLCTALAGPL